MHCLFCENGFFWPVQMFTFHHDSRLYHQKLVQLAVHLLQFVRKHLKHRLSLSVQTIHHLVKYSTWFCLMLYLSLNTPPRAVFSTLTRGSALSIDLLKI